MIWYFGGDQTNLSMPGAGISFNSGNPVPLLNSGMGYTEGSAVQCDENGALLFYTNGVNVFDRTHALMQNGNGVGGHYSSEQPALIIPFDNDSSLFYLFANDGFPTALGTGLHYSIIDLSLNGGLGAVTAAKDILLVDSTSEWLSGTKHANGVDYWVLTSDFDSTLFYAYKVNSSGISAPVVTNLGFNTGAYFNLIFNNAGDKLTFKGYDAGINTWIRYIADFNLLNGTISNPVPVDTGNGNDGVIFSPDDSLLYAFSSASIPKALYQYTVNSTNIYSTRQLVRYFSTPIHTDMKLGPNGKIYVAKGIDSLDVINFPNQNGGSCSYIQNAIYLNGRKGYFFPNKAFHVLSYLNSISANINATFFSLYPNPNDGQMMLDYTLPENQSGSFMVFDVTGNIVATIPLSSGSQHQLISLDRLASGLYYYQVIFDGVLVKKDKIVILR
jgi:hypothetical protein